MIITTSQTVEGRQISEYLGIVSAAQQDYRLDLEIVLVIGIELV